MSEDPWHDKTRTDRDKERAGSDEAKADNRPRGEVVAWVLVVLSAFALVAYLVTAMRAADSAEIAEVIVAAGGLLAAAGAATRSARRRLRSMAERLGPFAAAAGPDLLRAVRDAGRERRFARGETIQVASTLNPEGPILVVETGFVATAAIAAGGQYTLLSIHGPGDLVGEHALFDNTSEALGRTVRGITKGSAWLMRQERFRQILHDHPEGWRVLARHLNGRAGAAEERMCLMASEAVKRRLAVFLLQLLARADPQAPSDRAQLVPLPLSQTEMAEWVGVSRETVERVLREWVCDGTVQTGRRSLLIRDIARLEKIADAWRPFPLPSRPRPACRSGLRHTPEPRQRPLEGLSPAIMHSTYTRHHAQYLYQRSVWAQPSRPEPTWTSTGRQGPRATTPGGPATCDNAPESAKKPGCLC